MILIKESKIVQNYVMGKDSYNDSIVKYFIENDNTERMEINQIEYIFLQSLFINESNNKRR